MAENGIRTGDLDAGSLLEEVLGNGEAGTVRVPVGAFATQLVGSGAVYQRFAEVEGKVTSGLLVASNFIELRDTTPAQDGTGGEVSVDDTGAHADASATGYNGATVPNRGLFRWVAAWGRWKYVGPRTVPAGWVAGLSDALDEKVDASALAADTASALNAEDAAGGVEDDDDIPFLDDSVAGRPLRRLGLAALWAYIKAKADAIYPRDARFAWAYSHPILNSDAAISVTSTGGSSITVEWQNLRVYDGRGRDEAKIEDLSSFELTSGRCLYFEPGNSSPGDPGYEVIESAITSHIEDCVAGEKVLLLANKGGAVYGLLAPAVAAAELRPALSDVSTLQSDVATAEADIETLQIDVAAVNAVRQIAGRPFTINIVSATEVRIVQNGPGGAGRAVEWHLKRTTNAAKLVDVWSLDGVVTGKIVDGVFIRENPLSVGSAFSLAMIELGTAFVGGDEHGYEEMIAEPIWLANGRPLTLIPGASIAADTVSLMFRSTVFTAGSTSGSRTDLADVAIIYQFRGGVRDPHLRIDYDLEWQKAATMQYTYLGMMPVSKDRLDTGYIAPIFEPFALPPDSLKSGQERGKSAGAFGDYGALSVEIETSVGDDFLGRMINLNATHDKYYPSHAGKGSSSPKAVSTGDKITAAATYRASADRKPITVNLSVDCRIYRAIGGSSCRIQFLETNDGTFQAGDFVVFTAGNYTIAGNTVNVDGAYVLSGVAGSSSTELQIDLAAAEAVSADWTLVTDPSGYQSATLTD